MSEHRAVVRWKRETGDFAYEKYNRDHQWEFDGDIVVPASSAPDFFGDEERVDPEEAFVAALSSCHMLTFLAIAAKKRLVVDAYTDSAAGWLEKNAEGKLAMTRVTLRPRVEFGGENAPSEEDLRRMHERAHEHCFIANSVRTDVSIDLD